MEDKAIEAAAFQIAEEYGMSDWDELNGDEKALLFCVAEKAIRSYEAVKGDGWRPIHDKTTELPENMFFLVATKDGNVLHSKEFGNLPAKDAMRLLNDCTHWRPLPQPPKSETDLKQPQTSEGDDVV